MKNFIEHHYVKSECGGWSFLKTGRTVNMDQVHADDLNNQFEGTGILYEEVDAEIEAELQIIEVQAEVAQEEETTTSPVPSDTLVDRAKSFIKKHFKS